jgi:hypothetical protein
MQSIMKQDDKVGNTSEPILEKFSTITLGTTPIGSADRAPDEDGNYRLRIGVNYRLHIGVNY